MGIASWPQPWTQSQTTWDSQVKLWTRTLTKLLYKRWDRPRVRSSPFITERSKVRKTSPWLRLARDGGLSSNHEFEEPVFTSQCICECLWFSYWRKIYRGNGTETRMRGTTAGYVWIFRLLSRKSFSIFENLIPWGRRDNLFTSSSSVFYIE